MVNLTDGKVKIREFTKSDIEKKIEWINDPNNNQFLHYDIPLEYGKTLNWFINKNNEVRLDCVIEYDNVPVGLIGLVNIDKNNRKAEYYITIGEQNYKRKGIAFDASNQLLNYVFTELKLNKIYLNVDMENIAACSLYEKIGFQCEGVFVDDLWHRGAFIDRKRYKIMRHDFISSRCRNDVNILVLSAGTRNKIIQYFRNELSGCGKIVAADMSELAPAIYEADKYYKVPRITDPSYIEIILNICKKERIKAVFSLIDPELSLLAKHEEKFSKIGVRVIGSSYELCERSLNKIEMYEWLINHNYKCAKSYTQKELFYKDLNDDVISFPVFIKPICGSASLSISKVYDKETVDYLFSHNENLMIQEYLNGVEIGADVYVDMLNKEVVSIFTKKKVLMRAGETDKSVSFKDERLFTLIKKFVLECGFLGQIDIDIFDVNGDYYISEVNPRFGGGYPHAHECGCNHIGLIINNICGIENTAKIGNYEEEVFMMKYSEVVVRK